MKKSLLPLVLVTISFLITIGTLHAQQPGINLEAIAKDRNNNPAKDRRIYVRVDIIAAPATNAPAFSEEHVTRTNEAGIFQITIGKGTRAGGTYNNLFDIPWRTLNYLVRIRVAIEPIANVINWNYQNEWIDLGTTPFGIVPYAATALTADNVSPLAAVTSFSGGSTGLTPATTSTGNVTLGGILGIANGGTGSSVKNFVDLSTAQAVAGIKTFSQTLNATGGINISNNLTLTGSNTTLRLNNNAGNAGDVLISQGNNTTPVWANLQLAAGIKSKNRSTLLSGVDLYEIPVSGIDNNDGISVVLEVVAVPVPIPSYYILRDITNNKVTVHFTAPYSGYVTWVIID